MIVHREYSQKSVDWAIARSKMPTASELGAIITPNFAIRRGDMFQTYLNQKLAELWTGGPLVAFNTFDMENGSILEDEARPFLAGILEKELEAVGFITNDDATFGCSPDGWNEEGKWGAEIKCPAVHTHVGYLRDGGLPEKYGPQVHGSMFATGAERWVFFSYRRGFPKLTVLVQRDPKIIDQISEAVEEFHKQFAEGWEKLCELNGGLPRRRTQQPSLAALQDQCDAFNKVVPVGTAVNVRRDDGALFPTKTRSTAWVMGGHSAMIMVDGISGGYLLERVKPV